MSSAAGTGSAASGGAPQLPTPQSTPASTPRFLASRPRRKAPRPLHSAAALGRNLWHLFTHTFASFESAPTPPADITDGTPSGSFKDEHISLCQAIFDLQERRQERLEAKAQVVQGVVALIAPLLIALVVLLLTPGSGVGSPPGALPLASGALVFVFVALVASLRAVEIRNRQSLHVGAVVSEAAQSVEPYDPNRHARGLLWCAAMNSAMNDHVADFVRSAQLFLLLSILAGGTGAAVASLVFAPEPDGTAAASLEQLARISKGIEGLRTDRQVDQSMDARINQLEGEVDLLRTQATEQTRKVSDTPRKRRK